MGFPTKQPNPSSVTMDDDTPMPTQGQQEAEEQASTHTSNENQSLDTTHQAAADQQNNQMPAWAEEYKNLWLTMRGRSKSWGERYFTLHFQPTDLGSQLFGWKRELLLSGRVLTWDEAVRARDYIVHQGIGSDHRKFAECRIEQWRTGETGMAGFNEVFDARNYQPEQWGGSHPAGKYPAYISATAIEPNSSGQGGNFIVEFTTPHGNQKKWYSLWHSNAKTVEGARKALSALCYATGIFNIDMNNEGKVLLQGRCVVDIQRQDPDSPDNKYMEVKKVYMQDGSLPGQNAQGQQGQQGGNQGQQQGQFGGGQPQGQGGFGGQQGGGQPQGGQGGFGPQGGGGNQGGQAGFGPQGGGQPQGQGGGFGPQGGQQGQSQGQGGFGPQGGAQGGGQPQGGFGGGGQGQPQGQDQGSGWGGQQGGGQQGGQQWSQNNGGAEQPNWAG